MEYNPLISIAVCTHNGERHLIDQLDSLINQSYVNLQIVIVDDKSNDETWNLLKTYEHKDSRIEIHQNELNLGYIKNFEKAIQLCKGDYITLCDQDDVWHHKKIETLLSKWNPENIMIYHNSALITEEGYSLNKTLADTIGYIDGQSNFCLLLNNCIAGHASMFKRELLKHIFPFPQTIPHDHWISYIALTISKVQYLKEVLVDYRQHLKSITYTLHLKKDEHIPDPFLDKIKKRTEVNNTRISHLRTLKGFRGNTKKEVEFIQTLENHLCLRDEKHFSFGLFFFLLNNRSRLFKLYHKSFLSTVAMIYKESLGNSSKIFWNNFQKSKA